MPLTDETRDIPLRVLARNDGQVLDPRPHAQVISSPCHAKPLKLPCKHAKPGLGLCHAPHVAMQKRKHCCASMSKVGLGALSLGTL